MKLIHRLKKGWTALKFVRVGLGGLILYSSIESGQLSGILLGGLFTIFSLFTNGVCYAGGNCYKPSVKKNNPSAHEKTEYEELGAE
jgi:hypothetical protein